MRFERAQSGVNKIFVAEILDLVGAVLMVLGVFLTAVGAAAAEAGNDAVTGGFMVTGLLTLLPSIIIPVVAEVMRIVGLNQASKDEPNYLNKAFWLAIGALAVSCISGGIAGATGNTESIGVTFMELVARILNILVFVFTVQGINLLCEQVNHPDIAAKGNRILYIVCGVYVASLIATVFVSFIGSVATIFALILSIVAYVLYISFLSQARSALRG